MAKWFDKKFDENNVRHYTRKNLKSNRLENFFRKLSITNWLIIINVVLFVLALIVSSIITEDKFYSLFAVQANSFFLNGAFWTLLTSVFLHGSFEHLFANMLSLFFIGNFVEKIIGRKRFFWFYIISGIFASLFYVILSFYLGSGCFSVPLIGCINQKIFFSPETSAVGASGAIFALLGLLAILTPKNKVYLIGGPLIAIIIYYTLSAALPTSPITQIAGFLFTFYFIFSLVAMFSFNRKILKFALPLEMTFAILPVVAILPLIIIGLFVQLPIGNTAHLGGLIAGLCYGFYIKTKYKNKSKLISKVFSK